MFNVIQFFLRYFNLFITSFFDFLMCLLSCRNFKLNCCIFLTLVYIKMFKNILRIMSNVFNTEILNCILYFDFMRSIIMQAELSENHSILKDDQ